MFVELYLTSSPLEIFRDAAATARAAGLILPSLSTSSYMEYALVRIRWGSGGEA